MHRHLFAALALAGLIACSDAGSNNDAGPADGGAPDMLRGDGAAAPDAVQPDAAPQHAPITTTLGSYTLAAGNTLGYGLAYDPRSTPHRLYVADSNDHLIYAYDVGSGGLTPRPGANIDTKALHAQFTAPRGLALGRQGGSTRLYASTSLKGAAGYTSWLWGIDLATRQATRVSLDAPAFGLAGKEVFGLAHHNGRVYVSYDSGRLAGARQQVRRGILVLRVDEAGGAASWWARAAAGDAAAVQAQLPNSGRKVSENAYPRAPAFGLAAGAVEGAPTLWGTSYHKYLYTAQLATGRGLFYWSSPGARAIYGLASGGGYLWALDRVSGPDVVHKIKVAGDHGRAVQGARRVRRLRMALVSTATAALGSAGATHNFATVHGTKARPNQGFDPGSVKVTTSPGGSQASGSYNPAGDAPARQRYTSVSYGGAVSKGQKLTSSVGLDFWSSSRRHFVYPHKVNTNSPPAKGYTADCSTVYRLDDAAAYDALWAAVKQATAAEYGASAAASTSPYWRARDVMEYILERYKYGNVSNSAAGHYSYNPANLKLKLPLDGIKGNEKMSCSSSAFAMGGALRYLGLATRWVGTTKRRGGWDKDKDGYMTAGEQALDTSFHRWPEVWLGDVHGWQRFDPTPPSDGPRELSQFELMAKSAQGVGWTDLVLTLGSGRHDAFFRQKDHNQRYNTAPRYAAPGSWSDTTYRHITWENPCALKLTSPAAAVVSAAKVTVSWQTVGPWSLDPKARVSIYLRPMKVSGSGHASAGGLVSVAASLAPGAGSRQVSLSGAKAGGLYRLELRKDGDAETGVAGQVFTYSPAP